MLALFEISAAVAGFLIGWFIFDLRFLKHCRLCFSALWARLSKHRKDKELESQWKQAVMTLAGFMKAGLPMEKSVNLLIDESPEPLKSHILGKCKGEKWMSFEDRIKSIFDDSSLSLIRATLLIGRTSGAKIGPLLESCANQIREKSELKEKLSVLTANSRLTAWIVGLSPFFLLGSFQLLSPEYLKPLYSTKGGLLLLGLVAIMVVAGLLVVHRMAGEEI